MRHGHTQLIDADLSKYFDGFPHAKHMAAVAKVKGHLKEIAVSRQTWRPINDVVRDMSHALRGWSGYFRYGNCSAVLQKVKRRGEERLRIHLRRRHKVATWKGALKRYPSRVL